MGREGRKWKMTWFPTGRPPGGFLGLKLGTVNKNTDAHAAITQAVQIAQDTATLRWVAAKDWSQACLCHNLYNCPLVSCDLIESFPRSSYLLLPFFCLSSALLLPFVCPSFALLLPFFCPSFALLLPSA